MSKNIVSTIVIILTITNNILAQNTNHESNILRPYGYVLESINGTGFTNSTFNHITNISSSNPASIHDFTNISSGISYQFQSSKNLTTSEDITHERGRLNVPQSFGLVIPFKMLSIGFGFSQQYNSNLGFGKTELSTLPLPDGDARPFTMSNTHIVNSFSGLLSYTFLSLLNKSDEMSLGLQLNYSILNIRDQISNSSFEGDADDFGFTFGLRYKISDKFQFGLFYEKGSSFKGNIDDGNDIQFNIDPNDNIDVGPYNIPVNYNTFFLVGEMPDKLHFGLLYKLNSALKFTMDITNIYWNQTSENSENTIDLSGSMINNITKQLSFSLSFLSTRDRHNLGVRISNDQDIYSFYLLGGLNYKYKNIDLDFAYATDSLFWDNWNKQNIVKFSVGFYII